MPKPVVKLVERFDRDRKACPEGSRRVFLSPDYKEEQLRAEFLNPSSSPPVGTSPTLSRPSPKTARPRDGNTGSTGDW